ncbi:MAG: hypothetical protein GXO27_07155 [Chlorobi bacterium]|nr:hypothetical protein [Chlorobiota bacterium]
MSKKKAMSSEKAKKVRQAGHDDAKEFARLIGLNHDYQNDPKAKKDVIDQNGDAHSVKSGKSKWQIFLYSPSRFENDVIFKRLNGLGELFLECLNVFPDEYEEYLKNKDFYKNKLKPKMVALKEKLQNPDTLEAFFDKSFFNAGEVQYLTIKANDEFHVFHRDDVLKVLKNHIKVENSKKRSKGQFDAQKVVFKVRKPPKNNYVSIGEIEMRNDSKTHYKEMKFWMGKELTFNLLKNHITPVKNAKPGLKIYGKAIKKFKKY